MAATGILFYLHPVSTPAWAVAIWLSLWVSAPRRWSFWKKLGVMVGMGSIFMVIALPYIITYLSNHVQGKSSNYSLVYNIITNYMPANLINVPAALSVYTQIIIKNGLLPLALAGFIATLFILRKNLSILGLVLTWVAGLLVISILLPWAMHTLERIFHLVPTETELVRGIRYLIPFMLLFCFWPFYELSKRVYSKTAAKGFAIAGLAFVAFWVASFPPPTASVQQAFSCLKQGRLVCPRVSDYDRVIQAVKDETPAGAPLYVTFANDSPLSYGIPFRFIALHPLVYAYKDRGLLVYSNDQALRRWYDTFQTVDDIERTSANPTERLKRHLQLARQLGAQYLVVNFQVDPQALGTNSVTEIYRNPGFILLQIQ